MSPLQKEAVQHARKQGRPLTSLDLSKIMNKSRYHSCRILMMAYEEGALNRRRINGLNKGWHWEYSYPKCIKVFGMDVKVAK